MYHSWCSLNSELFAVAGSSISFSMRWRDQGSGGRYSRVRLYRGSRVLYTSYVAPHTYTDFSAVVPLGSGGTSLQFKYTTGQSNTYYRIYISSFQWFFDNPGTRGRLTPPIPRARAPARIWLGV